MRIVSTLAATVCLVVTYAGTADAQRVVVRPSGGGGGGRGRTNSTVVVQPGAGRAVVQPSRQSTVVVQPSRQTTVVQPSRQNTVVQPYRSGGVVVRDNGPRRGTWTSPSGAVVVNGPRPGVRPAPVVVGRPYYGPRTYVRSPVVVGAGSYVYRRPIRIRYAPPPLRVETAPISPGPGYVWVPGYWFWNDTQYVWISGHWERPPQTSQTWVDARWVQDGGEWVFVPGYWQNSYGSVGYTTQTMPVNRMPMAMQHMLGSTTQGTLQPGDAVLSNGAYADDYMMQLEAGQVVTLIATGGPSMVQPGATVDTTLAVLQNNNVIAYDDDGAGFPNAGIVFAAPSSGMYTVRVSTAGSGAIQGSYQLQSWPGSAQDPTPQDSYYGGSVQQGYTGNAGTPGIAPISVGSMVNGNLGAGDAMIEGGGYVDQYAIQLTAGSPVTIVTRGGPSSMTPNGTLDVLTSVVLDDGLVAEDDDSAGNQNSRIVFTPTVTGTYIIRVSTYGNQQQEGSYQLQVMSGAFMNAQ
jgi:hypothetical protein